MRAESNVLPPSVKIELIGEYSDVVLTENIEKITRDDQTVYQYDEYRISIIDRPGLQEAIEQNFEDWLAYAKSQTLTPPTGEERMTALENAMLEQIMGGAL